MRTLLLLVVLLTGIYYTAPAQNAGVTGPHLLVYKTKKDYSKLVPVMLSDDKNSIVSYPDPTDIKKKGKSQVPTSLHGRYLMDNTGIGVNTAFLEMKYTKYAALKSAPTIAAMYKMIKEKNPLTTLYDCGLKNAYKNPAAEINQLIDKKLLDTKCKPVSLKN